MARKPVEIPTEDVNGNPLDPTVLTLGKQIGDVNMAAALLAVDLGAYPDDPDMLADLLTVSKSLESKAMGRFVKLKTSIGRKLDDAQAEYVDHGIRSSRLFSRLANGAGVDI